MRSRSVVAEPAIARKVSEDIIFPGTLNILGKHWSVEWVENPDDFSDSEDGDGETIFRTQTIRIKEKQHFDAERDTLVHEIFHAIDNNMQLGLKEKQVHRLACAFYGVMRSNPDLVAHLMAPHPEEGA